MHSTTHWYEGEYNKHISIFIAIFHFTQLTENIARQLNNLSSSILNRGRMLNNQNYLIKCRLIRLYTVNNGRNQTFCGKHYVCQLPAQSAVAFSTPPLCIVAMEALCIMALYRVMWSPPIARHNLSETTGFCINARSCYSVQRTHAN